jgi:deoxyribonuclease-4
VHSGFGAIEDALSLLDRINDKRILIENMAKVGLNGEQLIESIPEQVQELMGNRFGFCFDINHAIKASVSLGTSYRRSFLPAFLAINPKMFHVSDGLLSNCKDEHLDIGEGNHHFSYISGLIHCSSSRMSTLETKRRNVRSFVEDWKNLKNSKPH